MSPGLTLTLLCLPIVAVSLSGGMLPVLFRLSHLRAQMMMSLVAGLMLGVALFVMLPHAAETPADLRAAPPWIAAGLLTMLFLLRAFHFHHDVPMEDGSELPPPHAPGCVHDHDHDHDHGGHPHAPASPVSWIGVALGLTLHTLLDGVALAAVVHKSHGEGDPWLAASLFLGILLHKPLDALAISALMIRGGWSARGRHVVNALFAMSCPLGAVLFHLAVGSLLGHESVVVARALAFSAGVFLCISLADLLPEIQFHAHHRVQLSLALLLGIGLAWGTALMHHDHHAADSAHEHEGGAGAPHGPGHHHHDHDH
jgi:zinc and cadmium transporter